MADSSVAVTAGSGTSIDTRTEGTNGNHRQVVVLGDPATNAGVAPVDVTAGLKVDLGADNDVTLTSTSRAPIKLTDVTLSTDTSAYASGDVLADTQVVSAAFGGDDVPGVLVSVTLIDESDSGAALDLFFLSSSASLGTENAVPSITDDNARNILGWVRINASDWIDLGGARIATIAGLSMVVKPASGTDDLYVAAITRGTPTYAADDLTLRIGIACQ